MVILAEGGALAGDHGHHGHVVLVAGQAVALTASVVEGVVDVEVGLGLLDVDVGVAALVVVSAARVVPVVLGVPVAVEVDAIFEIK